MSLGPHAYFGRRLCTPGDDATVDDIQACTCKLPSSLEATSALIRERNKTNLDEL